ncbi:hypothetical protein R1sor_005286 [Riccia sorocarpa]|uniref:PLAT domain-containing protein n=1 Tax=Riccia sorocarpa TaxID=122646 RepID=A0ABD3HJ29_9MARC
MASRRAVAGSAITLNLLILLMGMLICILGAGHTEARLTPDSKEKVEVPSLQKNQRQPEQCTYTVVTHTGNIENAETDADVNVEFFNKVGDSVLFVDLNTGPDNFGRGQTDTFTLVGNCVPEICKIHLSHDDAGPNPSWFINSISVSVDLETTVFNIYEWLAKDEPPYQLSYVHSLC